MSVWSVEWHSDGPVIFQHKAHSFQYYTSLTREWFLWVNLTSIYVKLTTYSTKTAAWKFFVFLMRYMIHEIEIPGQEIQCLKQQRYWQECLLRKEVPGPESDAHDVVTDTGQRSPNVGIMTNFMCYAFIRKKNSSIYIYWNFSLEIFVDSYGNTLCICISCIWYLFVYL